MNGITMVHKIRASIASITSLAICAIVFTACKNQETQFYQKSGFQPLASVNGSPTFFDETYVKAFVEFQGKSLELTRQRIENDYQNGSLTKDMYDEKMAAYQLAKSENTRSFVIDGIIKNTLLEEEASKRDFDLPIEQYLADAKAYTQTLKKSLDADSNADKDESLVLYEAFLDDLGMTYDEYASSYLAYLYYIKDIKQELKAALIKERRLQAKSEEEQNEAYEMYMEQLYQNAQVTF